VQRSITAPATLAAVILLGSAGKPAAADGLFEQPTLTGDWAGMRTTLKDAGIDLNANDTSEMLANPVGGIKQTTIYQGLLTMTPQSRPRKDRELARCHDLWRGLPDQRPRLVPQCARQFSRGRQHRGAAGCAPQ